MTHKQRYSEVKVPLWCPVQVQIFGQYSTHGPNHRIWNHFILLRFWPMFLLDIQVSIQQWYQVLYQSVQPYDIPYHVLSIEPSEHPTVEPSLVPGSPPKILFHALQVTTTTDIKNITISSSSNIYCQYFISSISPRGRLNWPITWFQYVLLQSIAPPILVQSRLSRLPWNKISN